MMTTDKTPSAAPGCPHCRRPTRTLFIGLECEEPTTDGSPKRVVSYDTDLTPKYEI